MTPQGKSSRGRGGKTHGAGRGKGIRIEEPSAMHVEDLSRRGRNMAISPSGSAVGGKGLETGASGSNGGNGGSQRSNGGDPRSNGGAGTNGRPVRSNGGPFRSNGRPVTNGGPGTSSYCSNPSSQATVSVSMPTQYPSHSSQRLNYQLQIPQPPPMVVPQQQLENEVEAPLSDGDEDEEIDAPNPEAQDFEQLLDDLLHIPGREQLPLLSEHPLEDRESTWFNRDKGKLTREIAGIFRRKFDGPYYSWSKTPIHIQERYFRTFARKYNWEIGITANVKSHFLRIAKNRMKGIVSQARTSGVRPYWISSGLWVQMRQHWNTPAAQERSSIPSQARNSDRNGLGIAKHVSGQKSYTQIQLEMEEEYGRPVSFGEVFMRTHTRADGSFVDHKAARVAAAYDKQIEEAMPMDDPDAPADSPNSSEQSTQRTLSVQIKNDIFVKCTEADPKGNLFGLGQLTDQIDRKGKRKVYEASSSTSLEELKAELAAAHKQIKLQEDQNIAREARIAEMEKFFTFLKNTDDPRAEAYRTQQAALETSPANPPSTAPPTGTAEQTTPTNQD